MVTPGEEFRGVTLHNVYYVTKGYYFKDSGTTAAQGYILKIAVLLRYCR